MTDTNTHDLQDLISEIDALFEKATDGPWAYRPQEFDDWGVIRATKPDRDGICFITANARDGRFATEEEFSEHRRNGTDPYGPNAELIVALVNAWPTLRKSLRQEPDEGVRERIKAAMNERVSMEVPDTDAVCTTCRGRGNHLKVCPRVDEPWPRMTVTRSKTMDEQIEAILKALPRTGEVEREAIDDPVVRYRQYNMKLGIWDYVDMPVSEMLNQKLDRFRKRGGEIKLGTKEAQYLVDLLAALPSGWRSDVETWRPMSEAPRDGTRILKNNRA